MPRYYLALSGLPPLRGPEGGAPPSEGLAPRRKDRSRCCIGRIDSRLPGNLKGSEVLSHGIGPPKVPGPVKIKSSGPSATHLLPWSPTHSGAPACCPE